MWTCLSSARYYRPTKYAKPWKCCRRRWVEGSPNIKRPNISLWILREEPLLGEGLVHQWGANVNYGGIFICPNCKAPTYFPPQTQDQYPGSSFGNNVEH